MRRVGKREIEKAESVLKGTSREAEPGARIVSNGAVVQATPGNRSGQKIPGQRPLPRLRVAFFNSIANKHADAMDNFPEPSVLPLEEGDKDEARRSPPSPAGHFGENDFEQTYSDVWWCKLKTGTGVTAYFGTHGKHNGLGDIDIRGIDLLNLFGSRASGISSNPKTLFHVELMDNELLGQSFIRNSRTNLAAIPSTSPVHLWRQHRHQRKAAVVDWYYKQFVDGRQVLQLL